MTAKLMQFLSFSFLLVLAAQLHADEWPRFRGPNGSGVGDISSFPNEFTAANYEWAVKLPGIGHSSPVVWGDKVFLTLLNEESKERRVLCYDSKTGAKLWGWKHSLTEHNLHKYNNFASSTPTVDKNHLYLAWGSGTQTEALALDHEGKLVWERSWPDFSSDHGFGSSPILVDGVLVIHTDSVAQMRSLVIGLDPATGETIWELSRITADGEEKHVTAYNTPLSVTVGGKETLVVLQTNDGWKGVDPKNGSILWSHQGDYSLRSVSSIASYEGMVFATFGSGGKGKVATALKPNETDTPEVVYSLGLSDGLGYVPTPLFHDGLMYLWGDGGILTCRNAETGAQVYQERVGGNFFSSPIYLDGKIVCGSRDGEFVAVKAGPKFEILGRSRLMSGMNATPAAANNRLYLRTDTHLISIKGK